MIQGIRVRQILLRVDPHIILIQIKPGRSPGKTCILSRGPLHGGSGIVPAVGGHGPESLLLGESRPESHLILIDGAHIVKLRRRREFPVLHPQLLPLEDEGNAPEQEIHGGKKLLRGRTQVLFRDIAAHASGLIVILDDIREEAHGAHPLLRLENASLIVIGKTGLIVIPALFAGPADGLREVKHTGEVPVFPDVIRNFLLALIEHLAHREGVISGKCLLLHFPEEFSDAPGVLQHMPHIGQAVLPVCGIIFEGFRLLDVDDGVHPEAAQALLQPPVDVFIDLRPDLGILPVEVRLLLVEHVKVQLVRPGKFLPAGAPEVGPPVGGKRSVRIPVPEIEELSVLSLRVRAGLLKPLMLIGAVVDHQVHQDIHIPLLRLGDQLLHIRHGAESGVNVVIIRDIVSLIGEGRFIDGGKPENIHAQVLQIIQLLYDSPHIPDPVAV